MRRIKCLMCDEPGVCSGDKAEKRVMYGAVAKQMRWPGYRNDRFGCKFVK